MASPAVRMSSISSMIADLIGVMNDWDFPLLGQYYRSVLFPDPAI